MLTFRGPVTALGFSRYAPLPQSVPQNFSRAVVFTMEFPVHSPVVVLSYEWRYDSHTPTNKEQKHETRNRAGLQEQQRRRDADP